MRGQCTENKQKQMQFLSFLFLSFRNTRARFLKAGSNELLAKITPKSLGWLVKNTDSQAWGNIKLSGGGGPQIYILHSTMEPENYCPRPRASKVSCMGYY